jgi:tripartite-type tricarboxylate transporter receptor subunit TctC
MVVADRRHGGLSDVNQMLLAAALAAIVIGVPAASAQAPSLADKSAAMIIASGPGGGFDLWGRTVARHIGKHLPGKPNVVPQNMPGAGGFVAANNIYNVAPKDGSAMAIIPAGTLLAPLMGTTGARFDTTRLTWVGTPGERDAGLRCVQQTERQGPHRAGPLSE